MLIEILGWLCTLLVVSGYWFNAKRNVKLAIATWIVGDIGWIAYDVAIQNWSHGVLSLIIIAINIYGIHNILKDESYETIH